MCENHTVLFVVLVDFDRYDDSFWHAFSISDDALCVEKIEHVVDEAVGIIHWWCLLILSLVIDRRQISW